MRVNPQKSGPGRRDARSKRVLVFGVPESRPAPVRIWQMKKDGRKPDSESASALLNVSALPIQSNDQVLHCRQVTPDGWRRVYQLSGACDFPYLGFSGFGRGR
jgi:hypothetical protein